MANKFTRKAPKGKTRVVGVDLSKHNDYLVGDYDDREKALLVVEGYNNNRSGPMDDMYYAYNDAGIYIQEARR